ncbi:uncharacterized protein LOC123207965 [Mangifera indica]|uniref:uncharacterized protein LOC123207965 n=1 Tax=Mangifera indica TaxID=29780 RepID=UPI001CFB4977|nr:uncharacterized protein LOC123207965 [Mangifera indica]
MSTLSERVGVLEALVGEPAREGESLAEQGALHAEAIAELKQITRNLQKECAERYNEILSQILSLTDRMEERVATLEEDLKIAKKAIAGAPSGGEMGAGQSKLKVPEPKPFGGSRNAKELENFLWDMDQYFKAARVAKEEQVTITAMYLAGDAKLWWRTRMEDDASAGRPKIESWEVLKRELKEQFLPQNSAWVARETLKKLKHTSSVREYVKEFSSLMLDIKNMSEEDKLFNFVSGLQPWAQAELRRQKVADLPSAVAAADGLVDYKLGPSSSNGGEKKKGRSERRRSPRKYGKEGWKDRRKREAEPSKQRGPDPTPSRQGGGCFLCAGPHRARDCPKREQLSALVAQEEKSTEDENPRLNPIQLLNAVTAEQPAACKGLMYAWVEVNGQQVRAMLDTGATNNFLAQRVVGKLGVTMEKCSSRIKAVNSASQPILGTAASRVKMGAWEGECTFMAVPLDDFDLILGLDFFVKAKAVAMPHLNGVMIMDEQQACFVKADANVRSVERVALQSAAQACAGLEHVALQSAAQVCAGLKRGEELVIAALVEIKEDHTMDVPDCVAEVLDRYADVMPAALPKTLPPKRRIDHKIELEPGARPPARAPYRMGPMELEELRKQLDELLEAGFIQPSKAPYGAPHHRVTDVLSRKEVHAYTAALTEVQSDFLGKLRVQAEEDAEYGHLREQVEQGIVRKYWLDRGLLYAKGGRLYVPKSGGLRQGLLKETHEPQWAGHPGVERMVALLKRHYCWPRLEEDVELYVRTCLVCQLDKTERQKQAGLLQPLPIPERPWESVSMDFVSGFPKVDGKGSVLVVVDRFSKYAVFIAAPQTCQAHTAAELFFRHVVKIFGLPRDIISDRDARFTGKFWTSLFKMMGFELKFSTANHPQTDGQTERVNALLEEYLRHYITASQRNWVELLDIAQFSYNVHKSSSTGMSPAEVALGQQPMTPLEVAKQKTQGECPAAYRFAREKTELIEEAMDSLSKAQRRMKKYADKHRRSVEFQEGDMVLLKLTPQMWKKITDRRYHKGLVQRYDGPFQIIKRVGAVAYRLQLPERLKIHPTFHVSFLKPYHEGDRAQVRRAPPMVRKDIEKKLAKVLDRRTLGESKKNRRVEYLIQWEGESDADATWERDVNLWQYEDQIKAYLETHLTRASGSSSGGGFVTGYQP